IRAANAAVLPIVQIEHVDAVNHIDEILAVPGLATVVVGPQDLAGSLGHIGEPQHPDVLRAIDTVLAAGKKAGVPIGLAGGGDPELFIEWAKKGARWVSIGADFWLLVRAMTQFTSRIREHMKG